MREVLCVYAYIFGYNGWMGRDDDDVTGGDTSVAPLPSGCGSTVLEKG